VIQDLLAPVPCGFRLRASNRAGSPSETSGATVAALRTIIKLRKQDKAEVDERRAIGDAYLPALGDLADLLLGRAAMEGDGIMPPGKVVSAVRIAKNSCCRNNFKRCRNCKSIVRMRAIARSIIRREGSL
jgi:hypothetical protein